MKVCGLVCVFGGFSAYAEYRYSNSSYIYVYGTPVYKHKIVGMEKSSLFSCYFFKK